jgi:hypothetical protein
LPRERGVGMPVAQGPVRLLDAAGRLVGSGRAYLYLTPRGGQGSVAGLSWTERPLAPGDPVVLDLHGRRFAAVCQAVLPAEGMEVLRVTRVQALGDPPA